MRKASSGPNRKGTECAVERINVVRFGAQLVRPAQSSPLLILAAMTPNPMP